MDFQERVSPHQEHTVVFQEHLCAYQFARQFTAGRVVLDVGCGTGYGCALLSEEAREVFGIDVSSQAIDYAQSHFKKMNLKFFIMSAQRLEFSDGRFDMVCAFQVLEHMDECSHFLSEVVKVLKPGGIFLMSTPNKDVSSPCIQKPLNIYHVQEFTLKELSEFLSSFFASVEVFGQRLDDKIKKALTQHPVKKFLAKVDFLNLRKKMPSEYRQKLGRMTGLVLEENISFKDFIISKDDVQKASNFLAVCQK